MYELRKTGCLVGVVGVVGAGGWNSVESWRASKLSEEEPYNDIGRRRSVGAGEGLAGGATVGVGETGNEDVEAFSESKENARARAETLSLVFARLGVYDLVCAAEDRYRSTTREFAEDP